VLHKGGVLKKASKLIGVAGFCFSFLCLSTVCGGQSAPADAGAATFKSKCAMCHGPDGSGKTAMGEKLKIRDLRSPDVQSQDDSVLTQVVTKGKEKMPSYDGKLTKEQIDEVVAYIRELGKKK
jgi:mono/diheme cytochrome c family protein